MSNVTLVQPNNALSCALTPPTCWPLIKTCRLLIKPELAWVVWIAHSHMGSANSPPVGVHYPYQ
jgi:hypothetical protein